MNIIKLVYISSQKKGNPLLLCIIHETLVFVTARRSFLLYFLFCVIYENARSGKGSREDEGVEAASSQSVRDQDLSTRGHAVE